MGNHAFVVKVEYHATTGYCFFVDTKEQGQAVVKTLNKAINRGQKSISVNDEICLPLDGIRVVTLIEKGTQYTDAKWLG